MERFKVIFQISALQILITLTNASIAPDPVAVYPLNSKYLSREIKDRLSPGILSHVSLAPGIDGKEGGSYQFAGNIGSYIEFPNNGGLYVKHSITILCWVYPQTPDGPLFQYGGTHRWGVLLWMSKGKLYAYFPHRNYQGSKFLYYDALALAFNQWHYVGCSYDFISGEANVWLNGQSVVKMNIGKEIELATEDEVRIGAINMDRRYFQGRVTAVQLYDVALNAEQIKAVIGVGHGADVCAYKKPCQNGGECSSSGDNYTCSCVEGFQGENCENDINECITLHPCQNGGQCTNTQGGYECKCKPGFIGTNCEKASIAPDPVAVYPLNSKYLSREIRDRLSPGILSHVSLAPGIDGKEGGSYQFAGNIGSYIEFPNNGGLDVKHSITILCWVYPQNRDGPLFQYGGTHRWGVHMWIGQGTLFVRFSRRNYQSTRHLLYKPMALAFNQWHYVGSSYDFISGEANLWLNGQSVVKMNIGKEIELATQDEVRIGAINMDRRYLQGRVTAVQLYDVALNAEQIKAVIGVGHGADVCADKKPCQNGGECSSSGDSYTCSCVEGFQGKNCENDINECITLHPCKNGGQCTNTQGGYECKCKPGFTGKSCEKDEDDCLNAVCYNGGKCIDGINSYTCDCKEGFIGEQCEWEKQGCFKEVKKKNKAMGKVLGKFRKYKKNIKGAVEACMKAAKGKKLEIFGVRGKFSCATTKGNADYKMHGASPKGCKEEGDYGVGVKLANYVYILKKN